MPEIASPNSNTTRDGTGSRWGRSSGSATRSVFCHNGDRGLSPEEIVVHAELDDVDPLVDSRVAGREVPELIDESHVLFSKVIEVVFQLPGPVIPEGVFNAQTRGPAEPSLAALEVKWARDTGGWRCGDPSRASKASQGVLVTRPGCTALHIEQPTIPGRVSHSGRHAGQPVGEGMGACKHPRDNGANG